MKQGGRMDFNSVSACLLRLNQNAGSIYITRMHADASPIRCNPDNVSLYGDHILMKGVKVAQGLNFVHIVPTTAMQYPRGLAVYLLVNLDNLKFEICAR